MIIAIILLEQNAQKIFFYIHQQRTAAKTILFFKMGNKCNTTNSKKRVVTHKKENLL